MEQIIAKLLHDFEQGKMNRRQLIRSLAVAASAAAPAVAAEGQGFKAVTVNHISYQVADYTKTRDFYRDLLGMTVSHDDGKQCYMSFGQMAQKINAEFPDGKLHVSCYTCQRGETEPKTAPEPRAGL